MTWKVVPLFSWGKHAAAKAGNSVSAHPKWVISPDRRLFNTL